MSTLAEAIDRVIVANTAGAKMSNPDAEYWDEIRPDSAPDDLITRDDLLTRVAALGSPMTFDRLRRWEKEGRLPRPARLGFPAKVWYPAWAVYYIAAVPGLLAEGKDWEEIGELLQSHASASFSGDMLRLVGTPMGSDLVDAVDAYAIDHEQRTGRTVANVELVMRDAAGRIIGRRMVDLRSEAEAPQS